MSRRWLGPFLAAIALVLVPTAASAQNVYTDGEIPTLPAVDTGRQPQVLGVTEQRVPAALASGIASERTPQVLGVQVRRGAEFAVTGGDVLGMLVWAVVLVGGGAILVRTGRRAPAR